MIYSEGDIIMLAEYSEPDHGVFVPEERAVVLSYEGNDLYVVSVTPDDEDDDGIREVSVDQIIGYIN